MSCPRLYILHIHGQGGANDQLKKSQLNSTTGVAKTNSNITIVSWKDVIIPLEFIVSIFLVLCIIS